MILFWNNKLGKYYLSHISPALIAEIRDLLLLHRKRTPSTVNRYIRALSKSFNICVKELGWLKENPIKYLTRPKENKPREIYLEKEQIQTLLYHCKNSKSPYLYPLVLFALSTGARRGEIMNLKWSDLTPTTVIFRDTKNGQNRSVPLSSQLLETLNILRRQQIIFSHYVFPSLSGKKTVDFTAAWDNALAKSNLKIRFDDLRHTTALHLAMSGAPVRGIAAILGHKTFTMLKRFSHLSASATAKALNKMNEMIFGT